jgi:periplasmic divalent cation tolerance protein
MMIVLTTTPTIDEAEALATSIVELRLAACVQIIPGVTSVYEWEGSVQKEKEFVLLIKTLEIKWDELREFIEDEHSYSVPEILSIGTEEVSTKYQEWILSTLGE